MQLELAESKGNFRYRKTIPAYHRRANEVPAHYRYLQDSSLFSFRLNDGAQRVTDIFLTVPDPNNRQAPRNVRLDMFEALPPEEFKRLLMYCEPFTSHEVMDAAAEYYLGLADGESPTTPPAIHSTRPIAPVDSAISTVHSVFNSPFTNTIKPTFWDSKILGVPVKYAVPVAVGLYLISKH